MHYLGEVENIYNSL